MSSAGPTFPTRFIDMPRNQNLPQGASLMDMSAANPLRVVDWRWQRAAAVRRGDGPNPAKSRDGVHGFKWIQRAKRFSERLDVADTDLKKLEVADVYSDIFWAHHIWMSANSIQRYAIEAYLLARESNTDIGFRCGVDAETIAAYEALFFNVREKMEHQSYILNCVIKPSVEGGIVNREYDLLWKLYGYFLGPYVVHALESKFSSPYWCSSPDNVNAAIQDDAIGTLKLKAALAAKTVPVNKGTQLALMDQFTKFVEVERNSDSAGKAQEQIMDNINIMMAAMPINVGGVNRPGVAAKSSLAEFEQTAIELTYEETVRLGTGQDIVNEGVMKKLAFPTEPTVQVEAQQNG